MSTSEDNKYFEIINTTFVAPVFFFLSFVLGVISVYSVLHAAEHPNYLVLGCLMFILAYNSFRFGKKIKGTCHSGTGHCS
jgi:hypothetical protein